MRFARFKLRTFLVLIAVTGLLIWVSSRRPRSDQHLFNVAVSRAVPKRSTLAQLESVAGPALRAAPTDKLASGMRRYVERNPALYPDGWQEGDYWVCYDFAGGHRWWFQIRNGLLVNYDPAVLASQPQESGIFTIRSPR